ncbi:HmuY family protein [Rhodohalobacter mucosus]|uniref:HmuY protein n=1 Tax=Rhodohalobacter mucosus TaxID=2079485 RepID=A0A316TY31_9BACT|nr:HmuY family protein [Rhodohalobacter mucosus]PWN07672.1 hypothetical protein DDZ15_01200 [Rhodohalobacter mucosus]
MRSHFKFQLFTLFIAVLLFQACSDLTSSVEEDVITSNLQTEIVEDLDATGTEGNYTFFSLRTGELVELTDSASTDWDIAFRGTGVITNSGVSGPGNGGALLLDVPFNDVSIAPESGYAVDSDEQLAIPGGSENGWYTYTGRNNPPFAILPMDDVTIVLKTADGNHYAKLEILSYYKGNPDTGSDEFADTNTRPESRFYTFRYAIQQTEGLRDLE